MLADACVCAHTQVVFPLKGQRTALALVRLFRAVHPRVRIQVVLLEKRLAAAGFRAYKELEMVVVAGCPRGQAGWVGVLGVLYNIARGLDMIHLLLLLVVVGVLVV